MHSCSLLVVIYHITIIVVNSFITSSAKDRIPVSISDLLSVLSFYLVCFSAPYLLSLTGVLYPFSCKSQVTLSVPQIPFADSFFYMKLSVLKLAFSYVHCLCLLKFSPSPVFATTGLL